MEIPSGTGTGFVWDDRGNIVTNFHVIKDASRAEVTLADGSTWEAKLVGYAREKDLAVLHIDAPRSRLRSIQLGTSSDLMVGQSVLAIGNPFGFRPDPDDRHCLCARPRDRIHRRCPDPRRDPDRCGHQSRKLGRPAPRQRRPAYRSEHGHRQPIRRIRGCRFRDPGRHGELGCAAADRSRQGPAAHHGGRTRIGPHRTQVGNQRCNCDSGGRGKRCGSCRHPARFPRSAGSSQWSAMSSSRSTRNRLVRAANSASSSRASRKATP